MKNAILFMCMISLVPLCHAKNHLVERDSSEVPWFGRGQLNVSGGIGYSVGFNSGGQYFPIKLYYQTASDDYYLSASPEWGSDLEYQFGLGWSVGLAVSYESAVSGVSASYFSDKLTRLNVALRGLKHLNHSSKYFVFRVLCLLRLRAKYRR